MKLIGLMYHELVQPANSEMSAGSGFDADGTSIYSIPIERFEGHLDMLRARGIPVRLVHDAALRDADGVAALITFDDGGRSNFEVARPLLNRFGVKAHFLVTTDLLDTAGFMTSEQVRTLHEEGHVIGAHGATHRYFSQLPADELEDELTRSREKVEFITGERCRVLCIPGGEVRTWMHRLFEKAGYSIVFGSVPSMSHARDIGTRAIGRISPRSYETLDDFAQTITPPYRWFRRYYYRYLALTLAKRALGTQRFLAIRKWLLGCVRRHGK